MRVLKTPLSASDGEPALFLFLLDERLAQTLLKHVGVEDRHLAVDDGKGQSVAVAAFAVAGKRTDAVGMGECARLAMDAASRGRVGDFAAERTVDAGDGELPVEHTVNGFMVVGVAQHGGQRQR